MSARRAHRPQEKPAGSQPPLDPALVRLIEALAEDQVEQDYARQRPTGTAPKAA